MSLLKFRVADRLDAQYLKAENNEAFDLVDKNKDSIVYLKEIKATELRTLSQNSLLWKWNSEIGDEMGMEPIEVHSMLKLRFGVPILVRDSESFALMWEAMRDLHYEEVLALIEHIDVTKAFTKKQGTEYMEAVQRFGTKAGAAMTDPGKQGFE